jgi:amino acid transporter
MNKLKSLFTKDVAILIGICTVLSILYGLFRKPFLLHFVDGLSISGMFLIIAWLILYWKGRASFLPKKGQTLKQFAEEKIDKEFNQPTPSTMLVSGISAILLSLLFILIFFR